MKTVYIEQDGKPIGYAVGRLGLDHIIRQAQSAQLLPYISHLCAESDKPSIRLDTSLAIEFTTGR